MDEAIYWRCRREGGAFWLADRSWLRFSGRDVMRSLNGQCTHDAMGWDGTRSLRAAIVFAKGCHIGQEIISRIKSVGHVNGHMVGLVFWNGKAPAAGSPILADGNMLGRVTTAGWSPALQKIIALAIVRRHDSDVGTEVEVDGSSAAIVALPFTTE